MVQLNHKNGKMLTKKQIELLRPFQSNVFKEYSFREIARLASEKSHNALQTALKQFAKEKIISEHKVGTSKLYKIKLDNDLSYDYLSLIKYSQLPVQVVYSIEALKKEIEKHSLFYSLVIFGSYSDGKQTKNSDLDIAIFIPDNTQEKNMKIAVNSALSSSLIPLHVQIISHNDFFSMLVNKQPNLGKEIAFKHRAIQNINIFYKLIKKAMEHGFNY